MGSPSSRTIWPRCIPEARAKKVYQRTSYLPGELAQRDWWQLPGLVLVGGDASRKVYGLVTTLPYSAAHACSVLALQDRQLTSAKRCLRTLRHLGGAPRGGGCGSGFVDRGVQVPPGPCS